MYKAMDIKSSTRALRLSEVQAQRIFGTTLWYLGFYLTDFMQGDISPEFLDKIQTCLDVLRQGGSKCVLRFAYKNEYNESEDMDPEVSIVLRHVAQLKPLLQRNEDVIFVLQAGFIGTWGEWYYTTHFNFKPKTDADYLPRKQLTEALLDALPASRQIQLRTPQFKMRMYNLSLRDTIRAANAHNESALSRLAGHNDCFGASGSDSGTFGNETDDRTFWKAETRYVIMGGETCKVSDYCLCPSTLKDMKDYHWTYLHDGYKREVLERWQNDGCMDEIKARLGYRLVMQEVSCDGIAAGRPCTVTLSFNNDGFASVMNPRNAILVWKSESGDRTETPLGSDPRTWQPGHHTVTASFTPTSGRGTLYLKLSDPLLASNPLFSIAFANDNMFDAATGLNKLFEVN